MNTTTVTNATNGTIVTVTRIHTTGSPHWGLIGLGVLAVVLISAGLYLLLRKEMPK
ncbi:MAG: hypothetical protein JWR26_690 [Pedosphaera sp.]|nr:hypothetical protein [Pedosphaera sp.]